jgi:hypothetical protein
LSHCLLASSVRKNQQVRPRAFAKQTRLNLAAGTLRASVRANLEKVVAYLKDAFRGEPAAEGSLGGFVGSKEQADCATPYVTGMPSWDVHVARTQDRLQMQKNQCSCAMGGYV